MRRRRLPLRPRPDAGPRAGRLRPARRLLRPGRPGPGRRPQAKLIAEPWDVGQSDSYDIGRFPPLWREWNGRYRDTMRDFWRSHDGLLGEFATRFAGSSDLYGGRGRRPTASVNLITVHDGFTLADLVSYDTQAQRGQRGGQPGRRRRQPVLELRRRGPDRRRRPCSPCAGRQQRALLTTLMLSFGVPLLLGGDELGRTQQGNNNAYCQDGPLTWFDWAQRRRGPARVHPQADRLPAGPPGVPAQAVPVRRRPAASCGGTPRQARSSPASSGPTRAPAASRSTSKARTRPTTPPTAARCSTTTSSCSSTPGGSRWSSCLPPTCAGQSWVAEIDTFDPSAAAAHGKLRRGRPGRGRPALDRRAARNGRNRTSPVIAGQPASSSASSVIAASMSARWVKACGKLPICSPLSAISSENSPTWLA